MRFDGRGDLGEISTKILDLNATCQFWFDDITRTINVAGTVKFIKFYILFSLIPA
jgi:hypothetical protein